MSTEQIIKVNYGLSQPLIDNSPQPIVTKRDPTTKDSAKLGTLWINTSNNNAFVITSIIAGNSNWQAIDAPLAQNVSVTIINDPTSVISASDTFLSVDTTSSPITVELPDTNSLGKIYYIADSFGNAAANQITITTVSGTVLIGGMTVQNIGGDYGARQVIFNGTNYDLVATSG